MAIVAGNRIGAGLVDGSPAPRPVLAVGAVMVDAVCHVPRLPGSGEGVVVQSVSATLGGCALNSAAAVLDAGVPCRLFAPLGQGMFASFVKQRLHELGLEAFRPTANCAPAQRDSGACVCFVEPDGQRTMVTLPGIERHFRDEWFAELDAECAEGSDGLKGLADASGAASRGFSCALASGFEIGGAGGQAIVRFFERHPHLPLFFGPGPLLPTFPQELIDQLNALHPVWHLNDQEALAFTGCETLEEAGLQLADAAGNVCIITAGAQGSYAFSPKTFISASDTAAPRSIFVPSTPVPPSRIADTIGAGDTHLGALAAAYAKGMAWEDALTAANEAAARVVQIPGGMLSVAPAC